LFSQTLQEDVWKPRNWRICHHGTIQWDETKLGGEARKTITRPSTNYRQLRILQNVHDNRNNQDDESEETNEQIVAQLAREQQLQQPRAATHARRPPILGHRNGGNNRGNGRGKGFGDRGSEHAESDDPENIGMIAINVDVVMHEIIHMKRDL
jgi:hypothetical protein